MKQIKNLILWSCLYLEHGDIDLDSTNFKHHIHALAYLHSQYLKSESIIEVSILKDKIRHNCFSLSDYVQDSISE